MYISKARNYNRKESAAEDWHEPYGPLKNNGQSCQSMVLNDIPHPDTFLVKTK